MGSSSGMLTGVTRIRVIFIAGLSNPQARVSAVRRTHLAPAQRRVDRRPLVVLEQLLPDPVGALGGVEVAGITPLGPMLSRSLTIGR